MPNQGQDNGQDPDEDCRVNRAVPRQQAKRECEPDRDRNARRVSDLFAIQKVSINCPASGESNDQCTKAEY